MGSGGPWMSANLGKVQDPLRLGDSALRNVLGGWGGWGKGEGGGIVVPLDAQRLGFLKGHWRFPLGRFDERRCFEGRYGSSTSGSQVRG